MHACSLTGGGWVEYQCRHVGDQAMDVVFEQVICERINKQVNRLRKSLERRQIKGVIEMVPSYAVLTIYYDPALLAYERLVAAIEASYRDLRHEPANVRKVWLPALYGGSGGPDLADVARLAGLTIDEVIRLHAGAVYRVYMLGFAPGFPYLGGLPDSLETPRLATPRAMVRSGSVGIAGSQTGIYSLDTPGGWRIIAHMPVPLFQPEKEQPFLLAASDLVQFVPVEMVEYFDICREIERGIYQVKEEITCPSI